MMFLRVQHRRHDYDGGQLYWQSISLAEQLKTTFQQDRIYQKKRVIPSYFLK